MIVEHRLEMATDSERVWNVLTSPELVRQWASDADLPVVLEGRVGGRFSMNGDWHGMPIENVGQILAFERPRLFQYRFWSSLTQVPNLPENQSVVTFRLVPGTRLDVSQDGIRDEAGFGHVRFYWNMALERIKRLAENGRL